jgi:hypothetical protein
MKRSDLLPFALCTAVVVTLGMAMLGYQLWPLCVALFFLLLYAVANEAPEPVKYDLGMPARTLGHITDFDKYMREVHARAAADGLFRDRNSHERLGDKAE